MEISIDGELVYSKKKVGRHPTIKEIKQIVRDKVGL
jgi:predicted Rdx family selenoprotein